MRLDVSENKGVVPSEDNSGRQGQNAANAVDQGKVRRKTSCLRRLMDWLTGDKVVATLEDVVRFKERLDQPMNVDQLQQLLNQTRANYPFLAEADWQQAISVVDKDGHPVNLSRGLVQKQFPLRLQLPKERHMFAALSRQQDELAKVQRSLLLSQEQAVVDFESRIGREAKTSQAETHHFIQKEITSIREELKADRIEREVKHNQILGEMRKLRDLQDEKACAAVFLGNEIRDVCRKNGEILEEIPGTCTQLTKLENDLVPKIMSNIERISKDMKEVSKDLEKVPSILQELNSAHAEIHSIAKQLHELPEVCNDVNSKCGNVQQMVVQLQSLPNILEVTRSTCENIHRMGVDLKPVLGIAQQTESVCGSIQRCVKNLEAVPEMCKVTHKTCEDVQLQVADLTSLPAMVQECHSVCASMHIISDSLPTKLQTLHQHSAEIKENGQLQHMNIVDRIGDIGIAVSKSQPLTVEQYLSLTTTLQHVLDEMRNPIPQPKMSFANAVVHVHKEKKHDDVIVERFSSPKGKPGAYHLRPEQSGEHLVLPSSTLTGGLTLPHSLTGRLKNSNTPSAGSLKKVALPSPRTRGALPDDLSRTY